MDRKMCHLHGGVQVVDKAAEMAGRVAEVKALWASSYSAAGLRAENYTPGELLKASVDAKGLKAGGYRQHERWCLEHRTNANEWTVVLAIVL